MKLTVVDSCLGKYRAVDAMINCVEKKHQVDYLRLKDMQIAYCTGCWSCWTKTPGRCIHTDDTVRLLKSVINADMVLYITENTLGTMGSLMKKALDKHIPLVHPYTTVVKGECRHHDRYEKFPKVGGIFIDKEKHIEDYALFDAYLRKSMISPEVEYIGSDMITGTEESIHEYNTIKWIS